MDLGLNDKVVLVLAASKGLGLTCAKLFYQEGANVVICSRFIENLHLAKQEIQKTHISDKKLLTIEADLNNEDQIRNLVDLTVKEFGTIDILVHNAGGPPSGPVFKITEQNWHDSIKLNLLSFIRVCKEVVPIMEKQESGRIIAITSVSVKQPLDNLVLSNTTRLGVVGYAKTLANHYAKDNILINVVCPGPTHTNRMDDLIKIQMKDYKKTEEEVLKTWVDQIPMGRLGKPEELANLIVFLASEKASYITGTVIQVDGGFVRGVF
jgi:3-oxoacyl-[acyl-carrier protein] reductase